MVTSSPTIAPASAAGSPYVCGEIYFANPADAAIARRRAQERAERDAVRFAAERERMALRQAVEQARAAQRPQAPAPLSARVAVLLDQVEGLGETALDALVTELRALEQRAGAASPTLTARAA